MLLSSWVVVIWILVFISRWLFSHLQQDPKPASAPSREVSIRVIGWIAAAFVASITLANVVEETIGRGRLTVVAVLAAPFLIAPIPHWLAWRLLGPRGHLRLAHVALAMTPRFWRDNALGERELFVATFGGPARAEHWREDGWTLFVVALRAEQEADPLRADLALQLVDWPLAELPPSLRQDGVESVAWAAAERGDWTAVAKRCVIGRGRAVRMLRQLADVRLDPDGASTTLLWLTWAMAPERRRAWPLLRAATRPAAAGGAAQAGEPLPFEPPTVGAPLTPAQHHVRLLARAAAGERPHAAEIEELARGWEERLSGAALAQLLARGLELGVRDVQGAAAELRASILRELLVLAELADGPWSREVSTIGLLADLTAARESALFAPVDEEVQHFLVHRGVARPLGAPIVELERWLRLRSAVSRLAAALGDEALATAWWNGLRFAACNWGAFLQSEHGASAYWVCRPMHRWSAQIARLVGDDEIARLSESNAVRLSVA